MQDHATLPARYDHVGSFLRPKYLLEAREQKAKGEITPEQLRAVEDKAITEIDMVWQATTDLYDEGGHLPTEGAGNGVKVPVIAVRVVLLGPLIRGCPSFSKLVRRTAL